MEEFLGILTIIILSITTISIVTLLVKRNGKDSGLTEKVDELTEEIAEIKKEVEGLKNGRL
tara:strand:- start:295 stop:477 length:183 start_codon:yes stop_codon:yes gene_type:complete